MRCVILLLHASTRWALEMDAAEEGTRWCCCFFLFFFQITASRVRDGSSTGKGERGLQNNNNNNKKKKERKGKKRRGITKTLRREGRECRFHRVRSTVQST